MNPIIQSLTERKSVRAYTGQEIPEDAVQAILAAAAGAPTAGNQQLYTILRINDAEKKFQALQQLRKWSLDMADAKTMGRERQKHFLQYAQQQVRENYIRNWAQPDLNYQLPEEREFSVKFAPFIHSGNVEGIMRQLDLAERQIEQNGNAKIIFFDLCIQMIVLIKKPKQ